MPDNLLEIIKEIPGYDPYRDAEGYHFDVAAAQKPIDFFAEILTHVKGALAGKPLILARWQQAVIANAFGWLDEKGLRRYRFVFEYVPRKNGKTTKCGGLVVYVMACDGEQGAEIYSAAAEKQQSALTYEQAAGMVLHEPELSKRLRIYRATKSITFEKTSSYYKALSADAETKHGGNTHFAIMDELHTQKKPDLVDVLETSTGSRTQPLIWYITTADFKRISICNEKLDYAEKVRDGIIKDARFLPVIYAADEKKDDWKDPEVWKRVNPNLGISVSMDYFKEQFKKALKTPRFENTFKRLHLNMQTQADVRAIPSEQWDLCADAIDPADLEGQRCYAGLDMSTTTDITAFVLYFPDTHALLPFFWAPAERAQIRENNDRVPYVTWARQGWITLTPGNVVDYDFVRKDINDIYEKYNILEVAADPWNSTQIQNQLSGDGINVVQFRQGFVSMNAPTKEMLRLIADYTLRHGNNPVLNWMASNLMVAEDAAGNLKPAKDKSREKIDGMLAAIMGIGRAISDPDGGASVYEERGILTI